MSIQRDVNELNQINSEIQRLTKQTSALRSRKKETEKRIIEYLKAKNQPGLKYQGTAIVLEEKPKRANKKKSQAEEDCIRVLEEYGVDDARSALKDIMEARRGEEIENHKIKIKKLSQF